MLSIITSGTKIKVFESCDFVRLFNVLLFLYFDTRHILQPLFKVWRTDESVANSKLHADRCSFCSLIRSELVTNVNPAYDHSISHNVLDQGHGASPLQSWSHLCDVWLLPCLKSPLREFWLQSRLEGAVFRSLIRELVGNGLFSFYDNLVIFMSFYYETMVISYHMFPPTFNTIKGQ